MINETNKNLHASVPATLLMKAQAAAAAECITLDELVADAVDKRVNRRELEEVFAFGKAHSKARGLKRGDVHEAIARIRAGDDQRRR